MNRCAHYLAAIGALFNAIQVLERTQQEGGNPTTLQQRIKALEEQIALLEKDYANCLHPPRP